MCTCMSELKLVPGLNQLRRSTHAATVQTALIFSHSLSVRLVPSAL